MAIKEINESCDTRRNHARLLVDKQILIIKNEKVYFFLVADIFLIEKSGRDIKIYFKNEVVITNYTSLSGIEVKMPPKTFFRISGNKIINIRFIENIRVLYGSTLQIEILNGMKYRMSRCKSKKFQELMKF